MPNQITAWSYSRYSDYEQCPAKAMYKHVMKLKDPGNEAMQRGSDIHKLAEDFASGRLKKLPTELIQFKEEFMLLKKAKPSCEQEWAFDTAWRRTDWFAKEAWLRVKMDAAYYLPKLREAHVIDHKTGRYKPGTYTEQMELYGMTALMVFPEADKVTCKLWFLDSGDEVAVIFTRADLPALKKKWLTRTKSMLNDKRFAPKPGNHCRWCPFSKVKGGPCKF